MKEQERREPAPIGVSRELAGMLELSLCQSDVTARALESACREACARGLLGVCVNSSRVAEAAHWLEDSGLQITCAVGYPLGAADGDSKRFETEAAIDNGAHRIEFTANLGQWRDGNDAVVIREWRDVLEAADERPTHVRFEAGCLALVDVERLCQLARECGLDGLTLAMAGVDLVKAIRAQAGHRLAIKVELNGRQPDSLAALKEAGAARFGLVNYLP